MPAARPRWGWPLSASRRHFLQAAAGLAAAGHGRPGAGAATPLALGLAGLGSLANHAAAGPGIAYKALVCVELRGGSDGHNWVVPMDPDGHAAYASARGRLAVPLHQLQALGSPLSQTRQARGRAFGMPTALAPLRSLYERGQAAVVANVGALARPLSRTEALAALPVPAEHCAHDDQALAWQCLSAEPAAPGWGARMGDILRSANVYPVLTSISGTGDPVFLCGGTAQPLRVGEHGLLAGRALRAGGCAALPGAHGAAELAALLHEGLQHSPRPALPAAPIALPGGGCFSLAADSLARQLATVARIIGAHAALGARRQVFMVSMGGFDTHDGQSGSEPELMARLAHALGWFHGVLQARGLSRQVTLFTASEFGRTLAAFGDGSEHGWGNHHVVVGGAVKGGDIVGRFPSAGLGGADDVGSGRLLPSTSMSQLAATLGRWMGLSDADLLDVLPGLAAFDARTLALF